MGIDYQPLQVHDLTKGPLQGDHAAAEAGVTPSAPALSQDPDGPLTIPEAKRRLAQSLGVPENAIRISVEH